MTAHLTEDDTEAPSATPAGRRRRAPELKPAAVIAAPQAIAVDVDTACAMLGNVSRSTFLERVSRGDLPKPRKIGARSLWLIEELQAAARALPVNDERPLPRRP